MSWHVWRSLTSLGLIHWIYLLSFNNLLNWTGLGRVSYLLSNVDRYDSNEESAESSRSIKFCQAQGSLGHLPLQVTATLEVQNNATKQWAAHLDDYLDGTYTRGNLIKRNEVLLVILYLMKVDAKRDQLQSNTRGKDLDHKMQKAESDQRTSQATDGSTVQMPVFTAVGVRLRTCSCSNRKVAAAAFTFSSPSPVQFTICSWKNVDVELPNVNACSWARMREGGKNRLF